MRFERSGRGDESQVPQDPVDASVTFDTEGALSPGRRVLDDDSHRVPRRVSEIEMDQCPCRRILPTELEVVLDAALRDVQPFRRQPVLENMHFRIQYGSSQLPQRSDVVRDPNAPTVRAGDQVGVAWMDDQVVDGDGRELVHEPVPAVAAVDGDETAEFGSNEKQVLVLRILNDRMDRVAGVLAGDVARDIRPGSPEIHRLEYIRGRVVHPVSIEGDVGRAFVKMRCLYPAHPYLLRDSRDVRLDVGPRGATISRDLDVAVVRAYPNDAGVQR